jgi:ABC-2 type transport system ATP-binding protein
MVMVAGRDPWHTNLAWVGRSVQIDEVGAVRSGEQGAVMSVIELVGVCKVYREVVALADVDLTVGVGEVVGLLGPNGAGKSTLFEVALGLAAPSAGTVRVLGQRPGSAVRARVGAMLQNAGLPEQVTASELVRLVGRSYPAAVPTDVMLDQVGLAHRCRHEVATLSGGERQRLLLALALVGDPAVLLLDEPTVAMDLDARRRFWEYIRAAATRGTTVLFATHDLEEAESFADRVVLLDRGRVVADAGPAELRRQVSGCVVTLATDAAPEQIATLPGVTAVAPAEGGSRLKEGTARLDVSATDAVSVVVPLVLAGHELTELAVAEADLETAFAWFTGAESDRADSVHVDQGASP